MLDDLTLCYTIPPSVLESLLSLLVLKSVRPWTLHNCASVSFLVRILWPGQSGSWNVRVQPQQSREHVFRHAAPLAGPCLALGSISDPAQRRRVMMTMSLSVDTSINRLRILGAVTAPFGVRSIVIDSFPRHTVYLSSMYVEDTSMLLRHHAIPPPSQAHLDLVDFSHGMYEHDTSTSIVACANDAAATSAGTNLVEPPHGTRDGPLPCQPSTVAKNRKHAGSVSSPPRAFLLHVVTGRGGIVAVPSLIIIPSIHTMGDTRGRKKESDVYDSVWVAFGWLMAHLAKCIHTAAAVAFAWYVSSIAAVEADR